MNIIRDQISLADLNQMAKSKFGNLVKAVVDVDREIVALDAELHADEEAILLQDGSKQESLWGINIYPELKDPEWIEFDSMINMRPAKGNRTRGIEDPIVKDRIIRIVRKMVVK